MWYRNWWQLRHNLMQTKLLMYLSEFLLKPLYLQTHQQVRQNKREIAEIEIVIRGKRRKQKRVEKQHRKSTRFSSISVSRFRTPNECRRLVMSKTLSKSSSKADSRSSRRSAGNLSTTGIRRKQLNCKNINVKMSKQENRKAKEKGAVDKNITKSEKQRKRYKQHNFFLMHMIDQKFCNSSCMINITPNKVKKNLEKKLQDEKKKLN